MCLYLLHITVELIKRLHYKNVIQKSLNHITGKITLELRRHYYKNISRPDHVLFVARWQLTVVWRGCVCVCIQRRELAPDYKTFRVHNLPPNLNMWQSWSEITKNGFATHSWWQISLFVIFLMMLCFQWSGAVWWRTLKCDIWGWTLVAFNLLPVFHFLLILPTVFPFGEADLTFKHLFGVKNPKTSLVLCHEGAI